MFISPMLASKPPKSLDLSSGEWYAEEKFDGHRIVTETSGNSGNPLRLLDLPEVNVMAWSRYGRERLLPAHLVRSLRRFPNVILDGELRVPGQRSYGVTELTNGPDLVYTVFDILAIDGHPTHGANYVERRMLLEELFKHFPDEPVELATTTKLLGQDHMTRLVSDVWERDGEGLILKRATSLYVPGKRSKDFVKIKALRSATLTVIGFEESKGEKDYRGLYASVLLRDDDGFVTSVKTRNAVELAKFEREATQEPHPALGRRLCIEYQERTPDGCYRHPRWDRWESE